MLQYPRVTVFTCTEAETGNEWFSRYEATNYCNCILYVYVSDLYPTWSGSVWILEVDNLEINGGTGPRAVLCSLSRQVCMDAVMCLLSNRQSVICTSCVFLAVQFGLAGESHVKATLMGEVFRCEPRAQLPLARKL